MNFRLVFVALFVLSFNHVLIKSELRGERKEHGQFPGLQERLKSYREPNNYPEFSNLGYVKLFALERADDQSEKQFEKKLKQHNLSIPKPSLLKLLAKDLKEESKDENSSTDKRLEQRSASLFLDHLAQREARVWLSKKLDNHPYFWMCLSIGIAFYAGVKAEKISSSRGREGS